MKTLITHKTKDLILIEWSDDDLGCGQLKIKYNGRGGFKIDAEYMGMETVIKILKGVNL